MQLGWFQNDVFCGEGGEMQLECPEIRLNCVRRICQSYSDSETTVSNIVNV